MIRVLVIEDDGKTAAEIVEDFTSAGFAADREITGPGGLRRAQTGNFDVITLDRLLPGMDGLTLLDRLRASGVRTPVLVLSALSSVDERIRGLSAGGDDDLSKPFATAELRARVEVLARRPGRPTSCATPFLLGDAVKAALASIILPTLWRHVGQDRA